MRTWLTLLGCLTIASCEEAGDAGTRAFSLATWCWESECVQDDQVRREALAFAKAHAVDSMYIQLSVDYQEPTLFKGLETLARSAQSQGMSLRWVEGRPEWAFEENHAQALAALDNAAQINQQLMAAGRGPIRDIVYDVEPWALAEWEEDPGTTIHAFVAMTERLHEAAARADLTLWLALPFWFETVAAEEAPDAASVLGSTDGIVIMAYRDNADAIESAARPMIEHADALTLPVMVGVETKCVSPSFISFCESGRDALEEALSELRTRFENDRAVRGFAVHELSTWQALDGS